MSVSFSEILADPAASQGMDVPKSTLIPVATVDNLSPVSEGSLHPQAFINDDVEGTREPWVACAPDIRKGELPFQCISLEHQATLTSGECNSCKKKITFKKL